MAKWENDNDLAIVRALQLPPGKLKVVLDSDTYNETDDQFEITWALCHEERLEIQGFYAAPFLNGRSESPADGMLKSYHEIAKLLKLAGFDQKFPIKQGAKSFLTKADEAQTSEAVDHLIETAFALADEKLYVVATGALTNVASAIIKEPRIVDRIVVVWLGGQPFYWPSAFEFNLSQDKFAVNTVLDSKVPLVLVPAMSVASDLKTTPLEIDHYLLETSDAGDYLARLTRSFLMQILEKGDHGLTKIAKDKNPYLRGQNDLDVSKFEPINSPVAKGKIVWDLAPLAFLINPLWTTSRLVSAPRIAADDTWVFPENRHPIRVVTHVNRDGIFGDLFERISKLPKTK